MYIIYIYPQNNWWSKHVKTLWDILKWQMTMVNLLPSPQQNEYRLISFAGILIVQWSSGIHDQSIEKLWIIWWNFSKQWSIKLYNNYHQLSIDYDILQFFSHGFSAGYSVVFPLFSPGYLHMIVSGWWFQSLWTIWVRQLGLWHSQYMESHKNPCSKPPNSHLLIMTF